MATELITSARPVFAEAVAKAEMGEEITWDLTWATLSTPQGLIIGYSVYIHIPALHQLGAFLQRTFIAPIGAPASVIERLVNEQVSDLRDERSRLLNQSSNGTGNFPH